MPYIELPDGELIVDIPDAQIQGVTMKRKAHCHTVQIEDVDKRVVMYIQIFYYDSDGNKIDNPSIGITSYLRTIIADNNVFVNMATGEQVCLVSEEYDQDGKLNPLLEGINYTKEYMFFSKVMTVPTIINDIKRNKILYSSQIGRLD